MKSNSGRIALAAVSVGIAVGLHAAEALPTAAGAVSASAVPGAVGHVLSTDQSTVTGGVTDGRVASAAERIRLAEAALRPFIERGEVAGAIAMTSVSGRVESVYLGFENPVTGRRPDAGSYFWIASMTKGFTAAAVMTCVDRGLLALDDPVEKYVPEAAALKVREKLADGTERLREPKVKMTIRMCLAHVAGFDFTSVPCAEIPRRIGSIAMVRDPMTSYQYANFDIELAARCVEAVTGMSIERYMEETFFGPLGMKEISFHPTEERLSRLFFVSRVEENSHYEDGNSDHWAERRRRYPKESPRAAGGLFSTAGDVMKFYAMLANDGRAPDGRRILSHESIVQLSTTQYPQFNRYSLGLRQFGDWFGHDGALQTEAYANWKQNTAVLLYVQLTGKWNHPLKTAWRRSQGL